MKKILGGLLLLGTISAYAQPDKIVYYEDARVKNSRLSLALNFNPNFTDRKLISNEVPTGGWLQLKDENAKGAFEFNYGLDVFFRIGSALDIGVGFGMAQGDFSTTNAIYSLDRDSVKVNVNTNVDMYTLPIKLNFNTSVSDAFDLEVIPMVQLNFINQYKSRFEPLNGESAFEKDFSDRATPLTYSVGIALGGTFKFADNWGVFVRGNVKYMLNPLIEETNYPRETLIDFGLNLGLKYSF